MLPNLCEEYKRKLSDVKLVILFGSYSRGNYTESSDVDILVVSDELPKDPREAFLRAFIMEYPNIMPTAMNTEVFMNKLRSGSTFILEILEDGRILCANDEFLGKVWEEYDAVRKRFRREGNVWSWH